MSDRDAFDQLVVNVVTMLSALHPHRLRLGDLQETYGPGTRAAQGVIREVRCRDREGRRRDRNVIRDMLGPQIRLSSAGRVDFSSRPVGKARAEGLADAILRLINSSSQQPSKDKIATIILEYMNLPQPKGDADNG